MPVLSYIHQLFNIDQCQAYIHTLRMERSSTPVSPLPEPQHRSLGYVPLPAGTETLPL